MSNSEVTKAEKQQSLDKNLRLVKLFFQVLAFISALIFLGMIITMAVIYGVDVTANSTFELVGGKTIGIIGIPLFSVVILSSIVIGILNLRESTMENEEELKEFKLVDETEEQKNE